MCEHLEFNMQIYAKFWFYAKLILLKMILKIKTFIYVYFASRDYIQVPYQGLPY